MGHHSTKYWRKFQTLKSGLRLKMITLYYTCCEGISLTESIVSGVEEVTTSLHIDLVYACITGTGDRDSVQQRNS
jgi:hypothetical protein